MADIRINKIMRQFNIGLDDLVEFLRGQGVDVDQNPNAKGRPLDTGAVSMTSTHSRSSCLKISIFSLNPSALSACSHTRSVASATASFFMF